jgi:hypothetical protein
MKNQTELAIKAHVIRGASYLVLLVAGTVMTFFGAEVPAKVLPRTLSFAERVAYQRAIEGVYWRHRIWLCAICFANADSDVYSWTYHAQRQKKKCWE